MPGIKPDKKPAEAGLIKEAAKGHINAQLEQLYKSYKHNKDRKAQTSILVYDK